MLLERFSNIYAGSQRAAMIVGKGPSIASLTVGEVHVRGIPFCCNQSVVIVGALISELPDVTWYAVQQDDRPRSAWITDARPTVTFLNKRMNGRVAELKPGGRIAYYSAGEIGCEDSTLTAVIAVKIARLMGITRFQFAGFDAWVNHKALGYWSGVPYLPAHGGAPDRFIQHQYSILAACAGCSCSVRLLDGQWTALPSRDNIPYVPQEMVLR